MSKAPVEYGYRTGRGDPPTGVRPASDPPTRVTAPPREEGRRQQVAGAGGTRSTEDPESGLARGGSLPSVFVNPRGQKLRLDFGPGYLGALRQPRVFAPATTDERTFFETDNKHAIQSVAGAYQASIGISFSYKRAGAEAVERTVFVFGDRTTTFWVDGNGFSVTIDTTGVGPFTVRVYKHVAGVVTLLGAFTIAEDPRTDYVDLSAIVWTLSDPMKFMVSVNGVYQTFTVAGLALPAGGFLGLYADAKAVTGTEPLFKPGGLSVSALNALSESVLNIGASKVGVVGDFRFIGNLEESGGKGLNRLLAKPLAADPDTADSVAVGVLRDVVKLTALTSGEVDFSKAGVLNRVSANVLRAAGGASLQSIVANLTDASHAAAAMQESGGKGLNRLYAKTLAADVDNFSSVIDDPLGMWRRVAAVNASNRVVPGSTEYVGGSVVHELYVRGSAFNNPVNRVLRRGRTTDVNAGTGRGFTLSVVKRSDHANLTYRRDGTATGTLAANQNYDVYGLDADRTALKNALIELRTNGNATRAAEEFGAGILVIVTSFDAADLASGDGPNLRAEMLLHGATEALRNLISSTPIVLPSGRTPYLLVGVPGIGEGRGIELLTRPGTADPAAEYNGLLVDGNLPGLGKIADEAVSTALVRNVGADKLGRDGVASTLLSAIAESGGKGLNRLLAKPLAADPDTADSVAVGLLRDVVKLTALTSGEVDLSKAGVLNRILANLKRSGVNATTLDVIAGQLADTGHAASGMQESGGKAVNRLFAKPLAADPDTADSVTVGLLRDVVKLTALTSGEVDFSKAGVLNRLGQHVGLPAILSIARDSAQARSLLYLTALSAPTTDLAMFAPVSNVERWNGTAFEAWATTGYEALLDGRTNTSWQIAQADQRFRFVLDMGLGFMSPQKIILGQEWETETPSGTVTIETSDAASGPWTAQVSAAAFTGVEGYHFISFTGDPGSHRYMRIEINATIGAGAARLKLTELRIYGNRKLGVPTGRFGPIVPTYAKDAVFLKDNLYALKASDALRESAHGNVKESGGKPVNRLFAKPLAADPDTADSVSVGLLRDVVKLTALTSGEVDLSKAGVLNRVAANVLRAAGGATIQAIVANLTDASHAAAAMQESGGKLVNRLLAKTLAADPDSLDGAPDGVTYKRVVSITASGKVTQPSTDSANRYRARAWRTTNQTLANATRTKVTFDAEAFDTGGVWDAANNRMVIPSTNFIGLWLLSVHIHWGSNATGARRVEITKNVGQAIQGIIWIAASPTTVTHEPLVVLVVDPAAGDFFEVFASQDSGGNLDIQGTTSILTSFTATHLW